MYLTSWHFLPDCIAVDANVLFSLANLGHSVEETFTQVVLHLATIAALHIQDAPSVLLWARWDVTGGCAVVVLKAHGGASERGNAEGLKWFYLHCHPLVLVQHLKTPPIESCTINKPCWALNSLCRRCRSIYKTFIFNARSFLRNMFNVMSAWHMYRPNNLSYWVCISKCVSYMWSLTASTRPIQP